MAGPALTPGEEAAIASAVQSLSAAQELRDTPAQVRVNDVAAITRLGVPIQIADAARAAGFTFRVDEYDGPLGRGWCLVVHLDRGGAWQFQHHEGPEQYRDAENGWRSVSPIGGA